MNTQNFQLETKLTVGFHIAPGKVFIIYYLVPKIRSPASPKPGKI